MNEQPDALPDARISRFAGLLLTDVVETIATGWPEFLEHIERDPARRFLGKYDHPGWSPAVFDPPIRARSNVRAVYAVVLDFNKGTAWDRAVDGWADWFGLVYTTKNHADDSSRLRIILPLSRPVTADEYARLWTWGASMCASMGLALADEPADPAAFWYDASTPKGTWRSSRLTGAVLDPGPILAASPPVAKPPAPNRSPSRPELRLITAADLEEPPPRGEPAAPAVAYWRDELRRKGDGHTYIKSYGNTYLIVKNHEKWAGKWAYDEMALSPMFDGKPAAATLPDEIRRTIEREYGGLSPARHDVECAIAEVAALRSYHPVRDYLRGLVWDGQERLTGVAREVLGVDAALPATLLRKWFIATAARGLEPGCKVDTALVLVGPKQGREKSTFFRALSDPWFSDSRMDIDNKDSLLVLHRAWIHEWGELERVVNERREQEVKGFLSSQTDLFRAPYARAPEMHPRNSVIVGSTNKTQFLTDVTGNRRFWIVKVPGAVDVLAVRRLRDQLWAEAVAVFDAARVCEVCGPLMPWKRCPLHRWWLSEAEDDAREGVSAEHQIEDTWEGAVASWIGSMPPGSKHEFTTAQILSDALKLEAARQTRADQMRVAGVMKGLDYEVNFEGKGNRRIWTKKPVGDRP